MNKNKKNVKYSAIVLDDISREIILSELIYPNDIFNNWEKNADHMTICIGELPKHIKAWLNESVTLVAKEFGFSDKAAAVKVTGFFTISKQYDDDNVGPKFQHVTLAVNIDGGKPYDSNLITNWEIIKPINLKGVVTEVI